MSTYSHQAYFDGKPVQSWGTDIEFDSSGDTVYAIRVEWQESDQGLTWPDKFSQFLKQDGIENMTGFIAGAWNPAFSGNASSQAVVEALVTARNKLKNLRAIFLGDIVTEESEISWIEQSDVSPLLTAYPNLEVLYVRGGAGLELPGLQHKNLKKFVVQTGGLAAGQVREIARANLPALEHLEIWLGTPNYGGNARVEDLQPILDGKVFPSLKRLGLRDSEIADAIAVAIANAPILERIEVLDLSMGTLGDEGGNALLNSEKVKHLNALDLHHHYMSDEVMNKFTAWDKPKVDMSDQNVEDEWNGERWRYVAVAE